MTRANPCQPLAANEKSERLLVGLLLLEQNVYNQAQNQMNSNDPYGKKGDEEWEQIALSEGWANCEKWKLAVSELGWNQQIKNRFPEKYGEMFYKLSRIGCSQPNMEWAICIYTLDGFQNRMISKYPSKKTNNQHYFHIQIKIC